MTAPTLVPDATRCPDCRATLAGTGSCSACGLRLTGPEATRLWEVDVELLGLERSRRLLLDEREALLRVLRTAGAPAAAPADAAPEPAEWTPQRVQNLLLTLGGLLLAGAALVFAAVTYERLGAGGRALVLGTLTALAASPPPACARRGLTSTAETVGAVVLALAALDAYGLRTLGLAQDSAPARYAAGCAAVLAVLAVAYGRLAGLRLVQVLGVLLSQLPVPLLLAHAQAPVATAGSRCRARRRRPRRLAAAAPARRAGPARRSAPAPRSSPQRRSPRRCSPRSARTSRRRPPRAARLRRRHRSRRERLATDPGRALLSCGAGGAARRRRRALLRERRRSRRRSRLVARRAGRRPGRPRLPQEERTGPVARRPARRGRLGARRRRSRS